MKYYILTSIIIALITSCTQIEFKEDMPKNSKELTSFPNELIGKYKDNINSDTLKITKESFEYNNTDQIMSLSGNLANSNFKLKKHKDFYYLNMKNDEGRWELIPFQYSNGKIKVYYLIVDDDKLSKNENEAAKKVKLENLNKITPIHIVENGTSDEIYIIDPSDSQLELLLQKGYFVEVMSFNKVK